MFKISSWVFLRILIIECWKCFHLFHNFHMFPALPLFFPFSMLLVSAFPVDLSYRSGDPLAVCLYFRVNFSEAHWKPHGAYWLGRGGVLPEGGPGGTRLFHWGGLITKLLSYVFFLGLLTFFNPLPGRPKSVFWSSNKRELESQCPVYFQRMAHF